MTPTYFREEFASSARLAVWQIGLRKHRPADHRDRCGPVPWSPIFCYRRCRGGKGAAHRRKLPGLDKRHAAPGPMSRGRVSQLSGGARHRA